MENDAKAIELSQGQVAWVSAQDYEMASRYKWRVLVGGHTKFGPRYYARGGPRGREILLHRFILGINGKAQADHINGETLDCTRSNLREASHAQNLANQKPRNSTGFKGVTKQGNKFGAQISDGTAAGKKYLGSFTTAERAARAYDAAAAVRFGEFAKLNFPLAKGEQ